MCWGYLCTCARSPAQRGIFRTSTGPRDCSSPGGVMVHCKRNSDCLSKMSCYTHWPWFGVSTKISEENLQYFLHARSRHSGHCSTANPPAAGAHQPPDLTVFSVPPTNIRPTLHWTLHWKVLSLELVAPHPNYHVFALIIRTSHSGLAVHNDNLTPSLTHTRHCPTTSPSSWPSSSTSPYISEPLLPLHTSHNGSKGEEGSCQVQRGLAE